VDFIARNPYNHAWKNQNYGLNFQKLYSNPTDAPNNNNFSNSNGGNYGNHQLDNSFKYFIKAQTEKKISLSKSRRTMIQLFVTCLINLLLLEMMCMIYRREQRLWRHNRGK
jgi:hypothetical protein